MFTSHALSNDITLQKVIDYIRVICCDTNFIIARSALYFLCVRGPARTLVCCLVSPFFEKIYTEQRQGDHAFTAWCFDRNIQNGHFSLFWNRFETRLRLHICGLRGPENGHISLFLDQFHQRLRLHICGLRGPEKGSVLTSGASRPCSAECYLVN